jgi:hypothetical protein
MPRTVVEKEERGKAKKRSENNKIEGSGLDGLLPKIAFKAAK